MDHVGARKLAQIRASRFSNLLMKTIIYRYLPVVLIQLNVAASANAATPLAVPDTEASCHSAGGRWQGTERGRGRLTGYNLKTSDEGKTCHDSSECEGPCLGNEEGGKCYGWRLYKGCRILEQREGKVQVMCAD